MYLWDRWWQEPCVKIVGAMHNKKKTQGTCQNHAQRTAKRANSCSQQTCGRQGAYSEAKRTPAFGRATYPLVEPARYGSQHAARGGGGDGVGGGVGGAGVGGSGGASIAKKPPPGIGRQSCA